MTVLLVVFGLCVLAGAWCIAIYNGLVRGRNLVVEAQSGMDVQLKRRCDLIPNLVAAVTGYMGHERGVLESVTGLRAQIATAADTPDRLRLEGELTTALGKLFAVAENYPGLRASENFLSLQQELAAIENELQLSRRYYNGAVRDFNNRVQSFPSNIVASGFGFAPRPSFVIDDPADRAVPKVDFGSGAGS
ncbi:MAG: LemA family protein [Solidesulfovibrio sp. DCME]|uniref:LemA family protein n=1 Tax=Solidesulfovibrio sp. DCME TaxID=3447380 RepID=UPI003D140655